MKKDLLYLLCIWLSGVAVHSSLHTIIDTCIVNVLIDLYKDGCQFYTVIVVKLKEEYLTAGFSINTEGDSTY